MRPLLIAALGNPGAAYVNTLHSAGQTLLARLQIHNGNGPFDSALTNGRVSWPPEGCDPARNWTLWQSRAFMNCSGSAVREAWDAWQKRLRLERGDAVLVVLHDELELPLGRVKFVPGTRGARGHNGIKSVLQSLGGRNFVRLGIGIGRPRSRDRDTVAEYVLRKMTAREIAAVSDSVRLAAQLLEEIANGQQQ